MGDTFSGELWQRDLDQETLDRVQQLSLRHKFHSKSLRSLAFTATNVTEKVLKVIAFRFGQTLESLHFRSCQVPELQVEWKDLSMHCHQLQKLCIEYPVFSIGTKIIRADEDWQFPLDIQFYSKLNALPLNKYSRLKALLIMIFNEGDYIKIMNDSTQKTYSTIV